MRIKHAELGLGSYSQSGGVFSVEKVIGTLHVYVPLFSWTRLNYLKIMVHCFWGLFCVRESWLDHRTTMLDGIFRFPSIFRGCCNFTFEIFLKNRYAHREQWSILTRQKSISVSFCAFYMLFSVIESV